VFYRLTVIFFGVQGGMLTPFGIINIVHTNTNINNEENIVGGDWKICFLFSMKGHGDRFLAESE